ncbi:hypothetical protein FH972_023317 [Carpinus fangiana]|uniref:Uncharacterized protein n=1 Tax=Carpinus fangiana TaxID=176857 RepID=A0A5N6KVC0_9ROSI|nr:hypothetical protein FH972_023317 [Carpinus fangiana]
MNSTRGEGGGRPCVARSVRAKARRGQSSATAYHGRRRRGGMEPAASLSSLAQVGRRGVAAGESGTLRKPRLDLPIAFSVLVAEGGLCELVLGGRKNGELHNAMHTANRAAPHRWVPSLSRLVRRARRHSTWHRWEAPVSICPSFSGAVSCTVRQACLILAFGRTRWRNGAGCNLSVAVSSPPLVYANPLPGQGRVMKSLDMVGQPAASQEARVSCKQAKAVRS